MARVVPIARGPRHVHAPGGLGARKRGRVGGDPGRCGIDGAGLAGRMAAEVERLAHEIAPRRGATHIVEGAA